MRPSHRLSLTLTLIAGLGLGCDQGPRTLTDLHQALVQAQPVGRSAVVRELRGHPPAARLGFWKTYLGQANLALHVLAAEEIERMGPSVAGPAIPLLVAALRSEVIPPVKRDLLPQNEEAFAIHRATNADPARVPVQKALAAMGAAALPQLQALLTGEAAEMRFHAAITLGRIGEAARPAVAALCARVGDRDQAVAAMALWALAEVGDGGPQVLNAIETASGKEADLVRLRGLELLRSLLRRELAAREAAQAKPKPDEPLSAPMLLAVQLLPTLAKDRAPAIRSDAQAILRALPEVLAATKKEKDPKQGK